MSFKDTNDLMMDWLQWGKEFNEAMAELTLETLYTLRQQLAEKEQTRQNTIVKWNESCYATGFDAGVAEEQKKLVSLLIHIDSHCLCTRKIKGFDYGEAHPILGKPKPGSRWLTPGDIIQEHQYARGNSKPPTPFQAVADDNLPEGWVAMDTSGGRRYFRVVGDTLIEHSKPLGSAGSKESE